MSTMPQVNSQITDAVTQANPRLKDNAEYIALQGLYQATAQVLGNAAFNAMDTQQQGDVLAQAATTQGVMELYSIDTAMQGAARDGDELASASPAAAIMSSLDALAQGDAANDANDAIPFDRAAPWSRAALELMGAVAATLREFQKVSQDANMAVLKQAAIAATLAQMLKAPDQFEQYQKILARIEAL